MEVVTIAQPGVAIPDAADAFADWVRPHLPAMSRLAARLAPTGERDDVVQEALTRAWRKRHQFDVNAGDAIGVAARDHRRPGPAGAPTPAARLVAG